MSHVLTTQTTPPLGAATEGGRRPTGVAGPSGGGENHHAEDRETWEAEASPVAPPNPETTLKPERRRFNKTYKLDLLRRADACSETGQIGALLRREGLFSSHLANWRFQRSQGRLGDAPVKKSHPKFTEDAVRMRLVTRAMKAGQKRAVARSTAPGVDRVKWAFRKVAKKESD